MESVIDKAAENKTLISPADTKSVLVEEEWAKLEPNAPLTLD